MTSTGFDALVSCGKWLHEGPYAAVTGALTHRLTADSHTGRHALREIALASVAVQAIPWRYPENFDWHWAMNRVIPARKYFRIEMLQRLAA